MAGNKKQKKAIRERMARTGETYSTARMHHLAAREKAKRTRMAFTPVDLSVFAEGGTVDTLAPDETREVIAPAEWADGPWTEEEAMVLIRGVLPVPAVPISTLRKCVGVQYRAGTDELTGVSFPAGAIVAGAPEGWPSHVNTTTGGMRPDVLVQPKPHTTGPTAPGVWWYLAPGGAVQLMHITQTEGHPLYLTEAGIMLKDWRQHFDPGWWLGPVVSEEGA